MPIAPPSKEEQELIDSHWADVRAKMTWPPKSDVVKRYEGPRFVAKPVCDGEEAGLWYVADMNKAAVNMTAKIFRLVYGGPCEHLPFIGKKGAERLARDMNEIMG